MRRPRECECVQVVRGWEGFALETAAIFFPLKSLINPAEFICVSNLLSTEEIILVATVLQAQMPLPLTSQHLVNKAIIFHCSCPVYPLKGP